MFTMPVLTVYYGLGHIATWLDVNDCYSVWNILPESIHNDRGIGAPHRVGYFCNISAERMKK